MMALRRTANVARSLLKIPCSGDTFESQSVLATAKKIRKED